MFLDKENFTLNQENALLTKNEKTETPGGEHGLGFYFNSGADCISSCCQGLTSESLADGQFGKELAQMK